jgi:3-phosphoglycerate kinase
MVGKVWKVQNHWSSSKVIMDSKLWNGPLGVFEMENFAHGTIALGNFIAELQTEHSHWWEAEILWHSKTIWT